MSMPVDPMVDASARIRRSQVLRYYEAAAGLLMPHLAGRPMAFLRAPEGIEGGMLLQKHLEPPGLPGVAQFRSSQHASRGPLLEVVEQRGVVSAANAGVIEFHTFNTTTRRGEWPDRVCFDLDPGDGVTWLLLCDAARHLRDVLLSLGLAGWVKTSGGKGLHLVVPLGPAQHSCDTLKDFSEALAHRLAHDQPSRFAARDGPRNHAGRVFVDHLRNSPGGTLVAAWSARAQPGLPISVPLAWDELPGLKADAPWRVGFFEDRVQAGNEPWDGYWHCRQNLQQALQRVPLPAHLA
jgi:bifunctional non-homologous end joining protein LigD